MDIAILLRRHLPLSPAEAIEGGWGLNFPVLKNEHLNARLIGRIDLTVRRGRLSLRACECHFHRRKVVEMHRPYQINIGRSSEYCDRAVAGLVFPETGKFLGERYVYVELVSVECLDVLRRAVNYYHSSHRGSPLLIE
jgi:hypothetical protein